MRKVECKDIHGVTVEEVLAEFNERRAEFNIGEKDLISMSVRDAGKPMSIHTEGGSKKSTVVVTIFYWATEE